MEVNRLQQTFPVMPVVTFLLALLCMAIGSYNIGKRSQQQIINTLISDIEITLEEVETVRTKKDSIINILTSENDQLKQVIASTGEPVKEIEYVVRTETKLVPGEPVIVYQELPSSHTFAFDNGLIVADFIQDQGKYSFLTHELSFRSSLAISENTSSLALEASSSVDPGTWVEIPVKLDVTRIKEHVDQPFFEPHLSLGVSGSFPYALQASVYSPMLHPSENWDLLGVRLSASESLVGVGLDAGYYNIAQHLPVLTDTWLGAGATLNHNGTTAATLTIGSKF